MGWFVGEIRYFTYPNPSVRLPAGWLLCDGTVYSVSDAGYQALFALLGFGYGGNGQSTFAVPDMRQVPGPQPPGIPGFWAIAYEGVFPEGN